MNSPAIHGLLPEPTLCSHILSPVLRFIEIVRPLLEVTITLLTSIAGRPLTCANLDRGLYCLIAVRVSDQITRPFSCRKANTSPEEKALIIMLPAAAGAAPPNKPAVSTIPMCVHKVLPLVSLSACNMLSIVTTNIRPLK